MTKWITLGTCGGPIQVPPAYQIANALVAGDAVYLFDVGSGAVRQLAALGIDLSRIRAVFLSHHHLDHVADLGTLIVSKWLPRRTDRLTVYGPPGTDHLVRGLTAAYLHTAVAFGDKSGELLAASTSAVDLSAESDELSEVYRDELITVEAIRVEHFRSPVPDTPMAWHDEVAVGFRVTRADGTTVAYTGDTGPCEGLARLADHADLLVSEVVDADAIVTRLAATGTVPERELKGTAAVMRLSHLEAREIGRLAHESRVDNLVLTHFVPLPTAETAARIREGILAEAPHVEIRFAHDLDEFDVAAREK